jgi:hypothetical protein
LADKPGSVVDNHSSGISVTAYLKRPTRSQRGSRLMGTYLVLLRVGFTMPLLLPAPRCALTAPFHPYLCFKKAIGGLLSAALSVGSRPPGVTWHTTLWSPDFPLQYTLIKRKRIKEKHYSDCLANSEARVTCKTARK